MTIVAMEVAGGTQADLELVVDEAAALLEGDCEDVAFGGSIGFGACYKLVFQQDISTSLYYVPVPAERRLEDHDGHDHGDHDMGYFAFFTQHVPVEFEDTMHYLKDDHGEDIEPAAELGGGGDEDDDDDSTVNERTWRMPTGSGGDNGIFEDEVDRLVERALGELDSRSQGKLTAIEQQRTFEVPERFWEKGRRAQARDEL